MRRLLALLPLLPLLAMPALAQQVPHPAPMSLPATNAALKAIDGGINLRAIRQGFTVKGDGGQATYNWSSTNCAAADDGAQVQPAATGCWIADFSGTQPVPEIWGAKGDGVANDAPAINAALAHFGAVGSGRLHGKPGSRYGIAGTVTVKAGTGFVGAGWDDSRIILLNGTFSPAIKLENLATFEHWSIDATPQNAGIVIQAGASGADYFIHVGRVKTVKGCVALDMNGVSHTVRDSSFELMSATAGCGGIRVGHNTTTAASTIEIRLLDTLVKCDFTLPTRADYGILLEDASGIFIDNLDNIGCFRGMVIRPGANQQAGLNFFNNSAIGDTAQEEGLLIDTGAVSAVVRSNTFTNTWTSGGTSPGGTGIRIQNTGGGAIAGTAFIGHRALQNFFNAIQIVTPAAGTITDTSFDYLRVCNTQTGTNFLIGANLDVALRNSRLGKNCDGFSAGSTTGLLYGIGVDANVQLVAIGNDLNYSGAESWTQISGVPARNSVVANNSFDTGTGPSYAAAATVTLNQTAPRIHLSTAGAATVDTIAPAWNGQSLCIIGENLAGAITFSAAGNIRFPLTIPTGGGMVCGHYDSAASKWILK